MKVFRTQLAVVAIAGLTFCATARADRFELMTGIDAGMAPGSPQIVSSQSGTMSFGPFLDGDRLAGSGAATPVSWMGSPTPGPIYSPNQFGAFSFMFRRGSFNTAPIQSIDYLGGPRLDLDGDLGNGQRSLARPIGATPAPIPGTQSYIDLGIDRNTNTLSLDGFDATGTNTGSPGLSGDFGVTTNVIAGTQVDDSQTGAINPSIDSRNGTLSNLGPGITQINNLGYEFWQDGIAESATPSTEKLGSFQYLGSMRGWLIERDGSGNFPTLTGQLGGTLWPAVDMTDVGTMINRSSFGTDTITDGQPGDPFSFTPGGLATSDLGAYLDNVVIPALDPNAQRFVYLESAGIGTSNSADPVFKPTNGYDVVLIGQTIPEPATGGLLLAFASLGLLRRRR